MHNFLLDFNADMVFITESYLKFSGDDFCIIELAPEDFKYSDNLFLLFITIKRKCKHFTMNLIYLLY